MHTWPRSLLGFQICNGGLHGYDSISFINLLNDFKSFFLQKHEHFIRKLTHLLVVFNQELRSFGVICPILEPGFYRTPLIDDAVMMNNIENAWKNASEEIRQQYGEEYKEECKINLLYVDLLLKYMQTRSVG